MGMRLFQNKGFLEKKEGNSWFRFSAALMSKCAKADDERRGGRRKRERREIDKMESVEVYIDSYIL